MAGGRYARTKWIAIVVMVGTPAMAIDRARLDRCQAQLGACYDVCKSRGTTPKLCNRKCTTRLCGLPWQESFGSFLDRRIEENAARTWSEFTGLKRLRDRRPGQDRHRHEAPDEERGPLQDFFSFFGLL
jgi:hypothetical protein